jgi:tetratricopeptide (TPR) repeat protein
MKIVLLYVLLGGWTGGPALAASCSGIETALGQISMKLAHDAPEAAQQLLDSIAQDHADCPTVLLAQARIEAGTGQDSQAAANFERYLQLQPEDANGYAYFARFLLDRNQYQRADDMSLVALEKDPNGAAALAVRGQILDMKGSPQQGLDLLSRACRLDPDPRAWDYLALNLEPLGEIDRAREAYAKGLAVNQQGPHFDAFLDYNYGRLLMKLNRLDDSKIHLDRAVELVPQMRATWYERAKLDLRLKDYQRARTDAEQAAAIPDPNGLIIDLQIYALLEQVYRRLGEAELAAKYAELGRQTPPPVRGEHH